MWTGALVCDLLLGDVHSLKEKRAVLRPLLAGLRRFEVSVAETGGHDLHRRAEIGVAVAAADHARCQELLDRCERYLAANPTTELLSASQRLHGPDD